MKKKTVVYKYTSIKKQQQKLMKIKCMFFFLTQNIAEKIQKQEEEFWVALNKYIYITINHLLPAIAVNSTGETKYSLNLLECSNLMVYE